MMSINSSLVEESAEHIKHKKRFSDGQLMIALVKSQLHIFLL